MPDTDPNQQTPMKIMQVKWCIQEQWDKINRSETKQNTHSWPIQNDKRRNGWGQNNQLQLPKRSNQNKVDWWGKWHLRNIKCNCVSCSTHCIRLYTKSSQIITLHGSNSTHNEEVKYKILYNSVSQHFPGRNFMSKVLLVIFFVYVSIICVCAQLHDDGLVSPGVYYSPYQMRLLLWSLPWCLWLYSLQDFNPWRTRDYTAFCPVVYGVLY